MESIDQKKLVTIEQVKGHIYTLCSIDNFITPTDEFYAVVEIVYHGYNRYVILNGIVLPNFDCENNDFFLRVSSDSKISIIEFIYQPVEESNDIYKRGKKRAIGEKIMFTLNLNDTNTA